MSTNEIPEALADEFAMRERRALAVASVGEQLRAEHQEAESQAAAVRTVVAGLSARVASLQQLRDRLEADLAAAAEPTTAVQEAETALAAAVERVRAAPVDDDTAATTAADGQAAAEDQLASAKAAQARAIRPLALRLQSAIEQVGDAERELEAAEVEAEKAGAAVRSACIELLRLRRDAAAIAFEQAHYDLQLVGDGVKWSSRESRPKMTLGECAALMAELRIGGREDGIDTYFGGRSVPTDERYRRLIPVQDPALLLDLAEPPAASAPKDPPLRRVARKAAALLEG